MAEPDERREDVQSFQTDWEDFGQKVDLTQRIREVLANYPEGTTILKELIQNADDSGASKVWWRPEYLTFQRPCEIAETITV
jgi:hypothetical protein